MKTPNRIDPTAAPSSAPLEASRRWYESPWVRRLAVSTVGATIAALCPFIPLMPLKAVCVAVAGVVAAAPVQEPVTGK